MDASIDKMGWFCPSTRSRLSPAPWLTPQSRARMPIEDNVTAWMRCWRPRRGHSSANAPHAQTGAATAGTTGHTVLAMDVSNMPTSSTPAIVRHSPEETAEVVASISTQTP